jgi:hypothetical protein
MTWAKDYDNNSIDKQFYREIRSHISYQSEYKEIPTNGL